MFYKILFWFCISFIGLNVVHLILRNVLTKVFRMKLNYGQCYVIATNLVSIIQATMVSIISIRFFITCQDILHDNDPILENYLFLLSAYFIYDLFVMYQGHLLTMTSSKLPMTSWVERVMDFFIQKPSIVIHHLLLEIIGIPVVFFLRRRGFGLFFMAGFFIAELSTPFHNIRSILLTIGIKRGFIYNVNGIMFLLTFFMARVFMVPYLYYRFAIYKEIELFAVPWNMPLHCHVFSLMFFMLQCYWFMLILRSFMKALSKIKTTNKLVGVDGIDGTGNGKIKLQ